VALPLAVVPATGPPTSLSAANQPKVDTPHPQYDKHAGTWQRISDCLAGVDQIRKQGVKYLPLLYDQEPMEYEAYKRRAKFVNFTAAVVEMLNGFVFRKDPEQNYPDDLDPFLLDCTLSGKSWYEYVKEVVFVADSIGRCGTLIDWSVDEKRPYLAAYSAEQIINWKQGRVRGEMILTLLVMQEERPVESVDIFSHEKEMHWRVYRLDLSDEEAVCICEVYRKNDRDQFEIIEQTRPTRRGIALNRIPFVFHGSSDTEPDVNRSPMTDISDLNIKHYMLSADLENGRHFCGLPTPWAKCFDTKSEDELRVGTSVVWTTENAQAACGYLEFKGDGLKSLETGIVETEEQMASLGARMLEKQSGTEAYQTVLMRQSGQSAALIQTSEACSASLTSILHWVVWWTGSDADPEDVGKKAQIKLNTDFVDVSLVRGEITEVAAICTQGYISRDTLHAFLQKAELIPADRDLEDEMALIEAIPPPGMMGPQGQMGFPVSPPGDNMSGNKSMGGTGTGTGTAGGKGGPSRRAGGKQTLQEYANAPDAKGN